MTQPEIRFNGFSDEWAEKKLGDVLKIPEKVEATVVTNEQLLTVKLHGGGVHEMPSNKLLKLGSTKYYVRKAGQLIYGKQNFFNGSMAIIPLELDGKASSGDVPSFDIVNADSNYLYQKISQPEFYKRTEDWASGTGSKRLHEKTIQQFPIQLPTLPEQQKIGSLFSKYDDIIALREEKLAELNALKKGLLQQMFPKKGAKVPELRFEGFADDWEELKLGEIGSFKSGVGFPVSEQGGTVGHPFYKVSDMNAKGNDVELISSNNYVSDDQIRLKNWNPINTLPAIVFAKVGAALLLNRKRIVKHPFLIDNNLMAYSFDKSWDMYFGKTWFDTVNLPKYAQTGALPSFNVSDIKRIHVLRPTLPEQQKIGQLFKQLDARISNEQTKIEQLKAQKQGLLQRML